MVRARTAPPVRRGAILLVVVSLLTLFAVVGLSFVLYANAEARSAQVFREAGTQTRPDLDPELLFSWFLGQLIYDAPNDDTGIYSALRGHSLARGIYGWNDSPGAANLVPYNGVGRLRDMPDYSLINYTFHSADGADSLRTPEKYKLQGNLVYTGGFNAPYTYPDLNNGFLAAVRGSDGAVLLPSFHRPWAGAGDFYDPQSGQLNPDWSASALLSTRPNFKYQTLRPVPALHSGFPQPEDGGGDVKNLIGGPGTFRRIHPATSQPEFWNNDSIWMDLDFPVLTAPDGRKYKPLFAALVTDLDNRVNVNVHGNIAGDKFQHRSNQGWGPWEVNLEKVLGGSPRATISEGARLFRGDAATVGRYGPDRQPTSRHLGNAAPALLRPHFYSQVDFDGRDETAGNVPSAPWLLPQPGQVRLAYPAFPQGYGNSSALERTHHPLLFDPFNPRVGTQPGNYDRTFAHSNMEALLRYGDTGSPALTADMYRLSPTGFRNPLSRRLVTTLSMDLDRPGVSPWIFHPDRAPYEAPPTLDPEQTGVPVGQPIPFPDPARERHRTGEHGEFNRADWRSVSAALGRINLNRPLPPYPHMGSGKSPPFGPPLTVNSTGQVALDMPFHMDAANNGPIWRQFHLAQDARQRLANDLYRRLLVVTGVPPIRSEQNPLNPPETLLRTRRWLAQLAANIVDYLDEDEISTPFCFYTAEDAPGSLPDPGRVSPDQDRQPTPDGEMQWPLYWVFGTELPRVVLNEVLATVGQLDPNDAYLDTVRVFVELHNTFPRTVSPTVYQPDKMPVPLRMQGPEAYTPYRVLISAKSSRQLQPNNPRAIHPGIENDNVLGNPDPRALYRRTATTNADFITAASPYIPPHGLHSDTEPQGCFLLGPLSAPLDPFIDAPPATPVVRSTSLAYRRRFPTSVENPPDERTNGLVVLLRRLANPYLPFDGRQQVNGVPNPTYNPFVTVDYLEDIPLQAVDSGVQLPIVSRGKSQPFAAHHTMVQPQLDGSPTLRHTFGKENRDERPTADRFDWLTHLDRPLVSPLELLHVSGCQPYQLTQRFIYQDLSVGSVRMVKFGHRAPWLDEDLQADPSRRLQSHRLYRLFEFIEAGPQAAGVAAGGRVPGKVNLNTVWDPEVFRALCDAQRSNHFQEADVNAVFEQSFYDARPNAPIQLARRTQAHIPGPNDRPFHSLAVGVYPPTSSGTAGGVPSTFLRMYQPSVAHPYLNAEMLTKIFNHVTTRSNVFAVYLTVGFFEVTDDSTRPVKLGAELGRAENRHVRHRMFAILDRTNLSIASCLASLVTPVASPGTHTVPVSALRGTTLLSMTGPNVSWNIQKGTTLVVDVGANQEAVEVLEVNAGVNPTITAVFAKPHALGAALSLPNTPGAPPVFLKPLSVSEPNAAGLATVRVPVDPDASSRLAQGLAGVYDGIPWTIQRGTKLILDVGPNQEVVTVFGREFTVDPATATGTFQVTMTRPHPEDMLITNTLLGNPGPQTRFNPRDPAFAAVVRYMSVIQ